MKHILPILTALLALASCAPESDTASANVSIAAHNFEVLRRVVFYNGITNEYLLTVEGLLSVKEGDTQRRLEVIVKTGPNEYKKHYLGLSDNVTYVVEQLDPVRANPYHYRMVFRPATVLPTLEVK